MLFLFGYDVLKRKVLVVKRINKLAIVLYCLVFLHTFRLLPYEIKQTGDEGFYTDAVVVLLNIQIDDVTEANLNKEGAKVLEGDFFDNRMLEIFVGSKTTSIAMEGSDVGQDVKFVFERPTVRYGTDPNNVDNTVIFIDQIKIKPKNTTDTLLSTRTSDFILKLRFNAADEAVNDKTDSIRLTKLKAIPIEAPSGFGAGGAGFKMGVAAWSKQGDVRHSGSPSRLIPPSEMVLFRFGPSENESVNIKIVEDPTNNPDVTVDGTSDYVQADNCLTNCKKTSDNSPVASENYFIGDKQVDSVKVNHITNLTEAGTKVYTDLNFGDNYRAVLQFKKGLARTTCINIEAQDNDTLAELNGEPEANLGDPRCFIVSASYGSPLADQVDLYRWFRDRVLLQTELGIRFVDFYYNHSEPIARVISESPLLQFFMQLVLLVPTCCLYLLHMMGGAVWLNAILCGFLLICVALFQLRRKKTRPSL